MKLPNKSTPYRKSIIAKFPIVLEKLQNENLTPVALYKKVKLKMNSITEFTDVLACLYALNKIGINSEEVLYYVEDDSM